MWMETSMVMEPILNSWNYFTFLSKNLSDMCFFWKNLWKLLHRISFTSSFLVCFRSLHHLDAFSFFIFFPSVHLPFIGWASYLSKLSLEVVIIPLFLSTRRKGVITRMIMILSFWRIKDVFFFPFFLWSTNTFMTELFLELIGWMSGLSMRASSNHVPQ